MIRGREVVRDVASFGIESSWRRRRRHAFDDEDPKAAKKRPLHVGALGAPDGLETLEGLALVFKPEE